MVHPDKLRTCECNIPAHIRESIALWVEEAIPPGGALEAFLQNDLMRFFERADRETSRHGRDIAVHLFNCTPSGCHGSPSKVSGWREEGFERYAGTIVARRKWQQASEAERERAGIRPAPEDIVRQEKESSR